MSKYTRYKLAKKVFVLEEKLKIPQKHKLLDRKISDIMFFFVEGRNN